jgi:hypothetical protein
LNRKSLLSILAIVSAALLPLAAASQVAPTSTAPATEPAEHVYKYEVYGGYAYTSLNQVNQSRYGLSGFSVSITRDFGRYFGVTAEGDYYKYAFGSPIVLDSTAKPSVESVLFGPVLHAPLYGHVGGFVHALLGGEHTAGVGQTPKVSFAGGGGGGLDYSLTPRFAIRVGGDLVGASFSLNNNTSQLSNSPHRSFDARASLGAVYHF